VVNVKKPYPSVPGTGDCTKKRNCIAIYETNENFRRAFNGFYHFSPDADHSEETGKAAHFFLEYWGMTALFHDVGYPFELTFEQAIAFFEAGEDDRGKNTPFIVYKNMKTMSL
jgi:hypothetical protein